VSATEPAAAVWQRVAYYTGCLATLSAKELDTSTKGLAARIGLELVELENVTCCGAGDIHEAEPDYYLHLNARILAHAEATGAETLMTVCNVCTLNLRQANFMLQNDDALRERVNRNLEAVGVPPYSGAVEVRHLLWMIAEGEGFDLLERAAHKGLKGLRVAPFYGCQILRPSKLLGFEDPDRPWSLEAIIEACGGESVDYPAKVKCCGFPIIQAREETALAELVQPIEQALERGADAMVTPCPLCHLSLDAWQSKLNAARKKERLDPLPPMPVLHLSQLIGVAAGLEASELKFRRHVVSVKPVLEKLAP
jgi:succinate dehydrogenase / fumarate reductase, cytochrome b subunit